MSQKIASILLALSALALVAAPATALAGTCGVLPFSAGEGVKRGAAPNISALVSSELDIRGGYDLVIAAPAEDFEGGDCGASTSCIREFGKANKHEAVVAGRVEVAGSEYFLTLKLHNGSTAAVIREVTATVPQSALALANSIPDVVIELATGRKPSSDEDDGAADADEGPLFDDVDFDDLMDEADEEFAEAQPKKKKRSRAAPRNPSRYEDEDDLAFDDEEEDDDPFGIDELDALDMSADEIAKKKEAAARQAELERLREEEEERLARERAEEERRRRIAAEREREERERARREREERERIARIEAERREEQERQRRIREEREREERERARAEAERREREERERQARRDREERERRDRERMEREDREREERERQARRDREERERRDRERMEREDREREERERQARADRDRRDREERDRRDREDTYASDDEGGDAVMLGSALSGIVIGGDDDDSEDDEGYGGGIVISSGDDEDDDEYDDYEVEDDEPRAGMIIGDDDEYENPNVRRRREAGVDREDNSSSDDRYRNARSFSNSSRARDYDGRDDYRRDDDDGYSDSRSYDDEDEDLDDLDDDYEDDYEDDDRRYDNDRSYEERGYGSERLGSRDDRYLSDDYDNGGRRSYTARRTTGAKSSVSKSKTGWGNRPWFSARVGGGYTNYYLHFAQYGVDLGIFPHPRVSVDIQADFWTLSIRECPDCEQQYRTLPSFYGGGSYRFTNLKIVQPYVGGDLGTVVYALGTTTDEAGNISRRPLMGFAFAAKGGADFMFTRHFGVGAGVKVGVAYAQRIKENVHPDWNPLQFLVNVRLAAVVQF